MDLSLKIWHLVAPAVKFPWESTYQISCILNSECKSWPNFSSLSMSGVLNRKPEFYTLSQVCWLFYVNNMHIEIIWAADERCFVKTFHQNHEVWMRSHVAGNRDCAIDRARRNWCPHCRLQKCFAVGMNSNCKYYLMSNVQTCLVKFYREPSARYVVDAVCRACAIQQFNRREVRAKTKVVDDCVPRVNDLTGSRTTHCRLLHLIIARRWDVMVLQVWRLKRQTGTAVRSQLCDELGRHRQMS